MWAPFAMVNWLICVFRPHSVIRLDIHFWCYTVFMLIYLSVCIQLLIFLTTHYWRTCCSQKYIFDFLRWIPFSNRTDSILLGLYQATSLEKNPKEKLDRKRWESERERERERERKREKDRWLKSCKNAEYSLVIL